MNYHEYTAMTRNKNGGTEAVTVRALTAEAARVKLLFMGYHEVLWVLA